MSREAREQRDFDLLPKAKKRRLKEAADGKRVEKKDDEPSKPGRKGFVMRARVPMPSNQDYVVRPKVYKKLNFRLHSDKASGLKNFLVEHRWSIVR